MSVAPRAAASDTETLVRPEALMRVPVGFASPLWGLFAGAAVSGAAWWWMTRWTRVENLEAMFGATAKVGALAEPEAAALAPPVAEVAGPALETLQALVETPPADAPVGGEAAPISAVVEALAADPAADADPTPKPRKPSPSKPA